MAQQYQPSSWACLACPDITEIIPDMNRSRALISLFFGIVLVSCSGDANEPLVSPTPPVPVPTPVVAPVLQVLGQGSVAARFSAEVTVGGRYAYSSTWGTRNGLRGNAIYVWDLAAAQPVLIDSVIVADAGTLGDIQVVSDAALLVVAVEPAPRGALLVFDLANSARPVLLTRYETAATANGVHTAQVSRVDGRLLAFLCIDPRGSDPARLVIVDLAIPAMPVQLTSLVIGAPFVHDVSVRDGILLTAEWNDGMAAYDIGGGGRGGTPSAPALLGRVRTVGGSVHNVHWLRDSVSGARYALIGEEGPGVLGSSSAGDVHVVDVSSWSAMREVAYLRVPAAGTHNFWVDESAGVLYAAYYNAGIRALDVRGDLSACTADARDAVGRCDLARMGRVVGGALGDRQTSVWGVDGTDGSVIVSDMLNGIWRVAKATTRTR